MRLAEPAQDPRARLTAVLRAGVLAVACLALLPLPVALAADPAPTETTDPDGHHDDDPRADGHPRADAGAHP